MAGGGRDTSQWDTLSEQLLSVARLWFLSDLVRTRQVEELYKAGWDELAAQLRPAVTDLAGLSSRLLEVGLGWLAKAVYEAGDSAGRQAAVPAGLVSQLAARQEDSLRLAAAGITDTVGSSAVVYRTTLQLCRWRCWPGLPAWWRGRTSTAWPPRRSPPPGCCRWERHSLSTVLYCNTGAE